ncbi:hypothetical protein ACM66B_000386 [Microbotryomycetes sp. NB124-2]
MPDEDDEHDPVVSDESDGDDLADYTLSEDEEETATGAAAQATAASTPAAAASGLPRPQTALTDMYTRPELPETMYLRPPARYGPSLHSKLWFNSDEWVNALRKDVQDLVDTVTREWTATDCTYKFDAFKKAWIELGWSKLLVLAFVEGPVRLPWCHSVVRAFSERISPDHSINEQVVCLFALYALWFSQTKTMHKFHIPVDSDLLEHVVNLPALVKQGSKESTTALSAKALGKRKAVDVDSGDHLDVSYVVTRLVEAFAFFIVPQESLFQPRSWPNVHVRSTTIADISLAAQTVLAIEAELEELERGRLRIEEWNDLKSRRTVEMLRIPAGLMRDRLMDLVPAVYSDKLTKATLDDEKGWIGNLQEQRERYVVERDRFVQDILDSDLGQVGGPRGDVVRVGDYLLERAHDMTTTTIKTALNDLGDQGEAASWFEEAQREGEGREGSKKRPRLDLLSMVDKDSRAVTAYHEAVRQMVARDGIQPNEA